MTFILPGGIGQLRPSGAGALAVDAFSSTIYTIPVGNGPFTIPMNMKPSSNATALVVVFSVASTYNMYLTQMGPVLGTLAMDSIGGIVQSNVNFTHVAYGIVSPSVAGQSNFIISDWLGLLTAGPQMIIACVSFKGIATTNTTATAFGPLSQNSTASGTIAVSVTQTNAAGLKFFSYAGGGSSTITLSGGTGQQNLWNAYSTGSYTTMAAAVSQGGAGSPNVQANSQGPISGIGFAVNP